MTGTLIRGKDPDTKKVMGREWNDAATDWGTQRLPATSRSWGKGWNTFSLRLLRTYLANTLILGF